MTCEGGGWSGEGRWPRAAQAACTENLGPSRALCFLSFGSAGRADGAKAGAQPPGGGGEGRGARADVLRPEGAALL